MAKARKEPAANVDDNGKGSIDDRLSDQIFADMVSNVMSSRSELFSRLTDPRRDLGDECGYPKTEEITMLNYRDQYDRNSIAARVVEVWPEESWKQQPTVFEDDNVNTETPFEQVWKNLGKQLYGEQSWYQDEESNPVWELLKRADILSGIGSFGIILFGIDDGLPLHVPADFVAGVGDIPDDFSFGRVEDLFGTGEIDEDLDGRLFSQAGEQEQETEDLESVETETGGGDREDEEEPSSGAADGSAEPRHKILYLRTFDESVVSIVQWERDPLNPRFGHPTMYSIQLGDPTATESKTDVGRVGMPTKTVNVHWSRVLHIADMIGSNEIFASPRQLPVFNRLLDLDKLYGGSAEGYWKGAFPGLSIESNPQLGGNVTIDKAGMRNQMENYQNGLQRWLALTGLTAKSLAPQVVDPTAQINVQIEAVCIRLTIPLRIFKGSERGELSSNQDDSTWNERLTARQIFYLTPRLIVPFVNRLILLGVLPEPKGFSVAWPGFDKMSATEKATLAVQLTDALVKYIAGGGDAVIQPLDFLIRVLGFDKDEADSILENTAKFLEEKEEEEAKKEEERRMREKELQDKGLGPLGPVPIPGQEGEGDEGDEPSDDDEGDGSKPESDKSDESDEDEDEEADSDDDEDDEDDK